MPMNIAGRILTSEAELTPGKWYAIGIAGLDGQIDWGGAQLLKYLGESCWADEEGEVEFVWDAVIQQDVEVGSADAFAEQTG